MTQNKVFIYCDTLKFAVEKYSTHINRMAKNVKNWRRKVSLIRTQYGIKQYWSVRYFNSQYWRKTMEFRHCICLCVCEEFKFIQCENEMKGGNKFVEIKLAAFTYRENQSANPIAWKIQDNKYR